MAKRYRGRIEQQQQEQVPTLSENHYIAKSLGPRGNQLHELTLADGKIVLASLPARFRKRIWLKRGNYAVLLPFATLTGGVFAEIDQVLTPKQIQQLQLADQWPLEFYDKETVLQDSSNDEDLFTNPNHLEGGSSSSEESEKNTKHT